MSYTTNAWRCDGGPGCYGATGTSDTADDARAALASHKATHNPRTETASDLCRLRQHAYIYTTKEPCPSCRAATLP